MTVHSLQPDDSRAFLQRRISRFGFVTGALFLILLLSRLPFIVWSELSPPESQQRWIDVVLNALAAVSFLVVGLVCLRGKRSERFCRICEALAVILAGVAISAMGLNMPPWSAPHLTIVLSLALGFFARAISVPSSARWTLLLTIFVGGIVITSASLSFSSIETQHTPPILASVDPSMFPYTAAISASIWWFFVVILSTLASRTIYGLRKQVREALRLGQYVLGEEIARGAMGVVHKARHAMLRRDTAIKLLRSEEPEAQDLDRFEREVRLTAKLSHPNIVTVFDYGRTPEGVFYCAMELLEGATIETIVASEGPQPPGRVANILADAASALDEAHGIGLIHRDIKPANIMLCRQGRRTDVVKLVDFGLVRELKPEDEGLRTAEGIIMGTPYYMAPEAFSGGDGVGPLADIYSLGSVGYFMLTGKNIFSASNFAEICAKHLIEKPIRPSERLETVPQDVEAIILACLEKNPEDRPSSGAELRDRLKKCDCFGTWTEGDAQTFWKDFEPNRIHGLENADTLKGTVDIDFQTRVDIDTE